MGFQIFMSHNWESSSVSYFCFIFAALEISQNKEPTQIWLQFFIFFFTFLSLSASTVEIWAEAPALHPAAAGPSRLVARDWKGTVSLPLGGGGIELAQGGLNMWACVNLLAGC